MGIEIFQASKIFQGDVKKVIDNISSSEGD